MRRCVSKNSYNPLLHMYDINNDCQVMSRNLHYASPVCHPRSNHLTLFPKHIVRNPGLVLDSNARVLASDPNDQQNLGKPSSSK